MGKESARNAGDIGGVDSASRLVRSPGGGYSNPLLAWRSPMDRGAWRAIVHRVAKESDTTEQLSKTDMFKS